MKTLLITFADDDDADIVRKALAGNCGLQLGSLLRGILRRSKLELDTKETAVESVIVELGDSEKLLDTDMRHDRLGDSFFRTVYLKD